MNEETGVFFMAMAIVSVIFFIIISLIFVLGENDNKNTIYERCYFEYNGDKCERFIQMPYGNNLFMCDSGNEYYDVTNLTNRCGSD